MAVTGQTYAERSVAEGNATTMTGASLIRVGEQTMTIANFTTQLLANSSIFSGHDIQAVDDASAGLIVRSFDNSPAAAPFLVEQADGTVLFQAHNAYNSAASGYSSARNVFPNRLWVTTDQTEPAWSNGDFWLRPKL